jgi:hypothetical protein
MSDDLPYATPYPWDNEDMEEHQNTANKSLRKRKFVGSGFAALYKQTYGPESVATDTTKLILANLLRQHSVKFDGVEEDFETEADDLYGNRLVIPLKEAVQNDMGDDEILELARDGKLSLFASLLKVIEESNSEVTTKQLTRTCCLTPNPGDVPGSIDAKEMVLCALHFLSSSLEASSDQLVSLPLIRPIQQVGDLEKRSYAKKGDWKLSDILDNILQLEQAFMSSATSWKWLARGKFCPRLSLQDEKTFVLKGSIPASATGKKAKAESTRKRKASVSSAGGAPSSPQNDDTMPVVEATVVMDGSPSNSAS